MWNKVVKKWEEEEENGINDRKTKFVINGGFTYKKNGTRIQYEQGKWERY